jgi:hypothetical protein
MLKPNAFQPLVLHLGYAPLGTIATSSKSAAMVVTNKSRETGFLENRKTPLTNAYPALGLDGSDIRLIGA